MMNKEGYKYTCLAEEKSDLSYVIKKIGLKCKNENQKNYILVLEKGIKVLDDKKQKLHK